MLSFRYNNVDSYGLKIIDDGEIDYEFPSLEPSKTIGLFGFTQLALVEQAADQTTSTEKIDVIMLILTCLENRVDYC